MSSGNRSVDFSGQTDDEINAFIRKNKGKRDTSVAGKIFEVNERNAANISRARSELKRRAKAREQARLNELKKEREETINLARQRPGRNDSFLGGGSNNPFRL